MAIQTSDADADRLLRALFDPACPRCHRADMIVRDSLGLGTAKCWECGWHGSTEQLETSRRQEPITLKAAWIVLMIAIGLVLGLVVTAVLR